MTSKLTSYLNLSDTGNLCVVQNIVLGLCSSERKICLQVMIYLFNKTEDNL